MKRKKIKKEWSLGTRNLGRLTERREDRFRCHRIDGMGVWSTHQKEKELPCEQRKRFFQDPRLQSNQSTLKSEDQEIRQKQKGKKAFGRQSFCQHSIGTWNNLTLKHPGFKKSKIVPCSILQYYIPHSKAWGFTKSVHFNQLLKKHRKYINFLKLVLLSLHW